MEKSHTMALFGEAEKGAFRLAHFCHSLPQLTELVGYQSPPDSKGLFFAVQALLFNRPVIFFRVQEEGFSLGDYFPGLYFLENRQLVPELSAICLPGVADQEILAASTELCSRHNSILITTESDLYDYLLD